MAFAPVFQSLNSDYAFLYLPAIAYGYLFVETQPHMLNLYVTTVPSHLFFQVAVVICVIGALLYHQVFRLIFGDGGPSENPKKTSVALKHLFILVVRLDLTDVENSTLEIFKEASHRFSRVHWIPTIAFGFPMIGMYLLTYLSVFLLYEVVTSGGSFTGSILLIAIVIPLIQARIWGLFPNHLPPDTAEDIWTPEYIRGSQAAEESAIQQKLDKWS